MKHVPLYETCPIVYIYIYHVYIYKEHHFYNFYKYNSQWSPHLSLFLKSRQITWNLAELSVKTSDPVIYRPLGHVDN